MTLDTAAAAALARAKEIGIEKHEAREHVTAAFAAVAWPDPVPQIMPRADELTPAQRALVAAFAEQPVVDLAFNKVANVRLAQWIGLASAGVLERNVDDRGPSLWRAMGELEEAPDGRARAFLSTLSIGDRLAAFGEVNAFGHEKSYRLTAGSFFDYRDRDLLAAMRDEGRDWAPGFADHLLPLERPPSASVRWPVFLALVRAGIPIEPRWDVLLPLGFGVYRDLTDEVVEAIAEPRRAAAIFSAKQPAQRKRHRAKPAKAKPAKAKPATKTTAKPAKAKPATKTTVKPAKAKPATKFRARRRLSRS